MVTYRTPNRHGYNVRFCPSNPDRLAVATSQYFGLAGGGTLFILDLASDGTLKEVQNYPWHDGLFDLVWSETNQSLVISACGDGSLLLWDTSAPYAPPYCFSEHRNEACSVDWPRNKSEQFLSASWDHTIKLWDLNRPTSLSTFNGHSALVYSAIFSPHVPNFFASVSGDGNLNLWSLDKQRAPNCRVKAHDAEVLSCDWSKNDENLLATSGSDGLIRGWDLRNYMQPVFQLKVCDYAVRRVKFSPHHPNILACVGFDFITRIWDFKQNSEPIETVSHHSEFVYGLDWNVHRKGQLADCGWDSLIQVFTPNCLKDYN